MNRALLALLLLSGCAHRPTEASSAKPAAAPADAGTEAVRALAPQPFEARPLATIAPLEIVKIPDTGQSVVELRAAFQAGAIDDPPGKEGLTALTVQLVAEGGTARLTAAQLLEALYPLAGRLGADVDKELSVFVGRVHQDKAAAFLDLFAEVLTQPRFDSREFDRLKTQSLNAIRTRLRGESDEELGKVALDALLYTGHPYRHFVGGTVAGLNAITLEDVRAQAKAVLTRDRLVLGLAGPIDAKLEAALKEKLAALPLTSAARRPLPPSPGIAGRTLILQRDTRSTAGSFGLAWPLRRGDPDWPAVVLALSYLGQHRQAHGQLFSELREKRGLNYGTYAYPEHFRQDGFGSLARVNVPRSAQDMTLWLRPVEPQNAVFATRAVLFVLERLLTEPIPEEAFETARGFLIGFTRVGEQTAQRRLGEAIDARLYGTADYLASLRDALGKLTRDEVQAAAKRHLDPSRLDFVFVTKDAAGLKAALSSKAKSPFSPQSPPPPEVAQVDERIASFPLPFEASRIEVQDAQQFMER